MEVLVEFIFELIFEGILEGYTAWRRKKNPEYNTTNAKKVIDTIIKVLIGIIIIAMFVLIIIGIEYLFPQLFDIIGLE